MRLQVVSLFRDCPQAQVELWCRQVAALADGLPRGWSVGCLAVEGDSVDGTRSRLVGRARQLGLSLDVVDCQVRVPRFPSCVDPVRLRALSACLNAGMEAVAPDTDQVIYVESDLLWNANTMLALSAVVSEGIVDVVAPLIFAGRAFYDIWAFRKNGENFSGLRPFHRELTGSLTSVESAGSCLIMRGEVARTVRVRNDNALVGWCDEARARGYKIYVDPSARVDHPA